MATELSLSQPGRRAGVSFANALRETLASAIVFVSAGDEALSFSPEAGRLLGLAGGPSDLTAVRLPAPLLALARQGLAGCPVSARQIQFHLDGKELSVDLSVVPLLAGAECRGALLVLNEVAAARQFETHLHQVNRLANAGTLAARMAHEIKNALVAGKTFVDLLLEKNQEADLADVVRRELGRIDAIVSRMLKLARPGDEPPPFTTVRVHDVLDYVLRLVQPELDSQGVELERSFQARQDEICGHEYELQQAILNLLLNAIEALSPGGTLSLSTELLAADGATQDHAPQIRVRIADNGAGISPEHLSHVFEPFFTTKPAGTGLGLAITRHIIGAHGGTITVQSQPGRGCAFELLLPVRVPPAK